MVSKVEDVTFARTQILGSNICSILFYNDLVKDMFESELAAG